MSALQTHSATPPNRIQWPKSSAAHPVAALVTAHARLDAAVAAAYGWTWPLAEDEVLARLLALNLERADG